MTMRQERDKEEINRGIRQEITRIQEIWQAWQQGEITLSEDQFIELENDYWKFFRALKGGGIPQKAAGNPTGRGRGRPWKT